jgi:nitrogen regulation protein NR(I)
MNKILVVDDEANVLGAFQRLLSGRGYDVVTAASAEDALARLDRDNPQTVVLDVCMPGMNGLDALQRIRRWRPRVPVIVMTGQGTMATAIEATKRGAFDYQLKPFEPKEMLAVIERALQAERAMVRQVALGPEIAPATADAIIGHGPGMQAIFKAIGRVAATDATVLIRGESGTGKELVARAIYQYSARSDQPFYVVNCAAIPETLLESELFGFERGSFTGAYDQRIGKLEQAGGGTLLLDEIGDVPLTVQAKLLRVLQQKTLERIGSNETIQVDVRILAATNRDLEKAIDEGLFREDLFHRLNVVAIRLPPLRDRREDIPRLVKFFLERFARQSNIRVPPLLDEALEALLSHPWSGNIRELEHTLHRTLIFSGGHAIGADDIRTALGGHGYREPNPPDAADQAIHRVVQNYFATAADDGPFDHLMGKMERWLIHEAIQRADGNLSKAAKFLGIPRATLFDKAEKHGLRTTVPPNP